MCGAIVVHDLRRYTRARRALDEAILDAYLADDEAQPADDSERRPCSWRR